MAGKYYMVAYGAPGAADRKWYIGKSTSSRKVGFSDGDTFPKARYQLPGNITLDQFIAQEAGDPTKSPSILGPFNDEQITNRAAMQLMDISGGAIQEGSDSPSEEDEAIATTSLSGGRAQQAGGRKRRKSSKHSKLKRKKSSKRRKTKKRKSKRRESRRRR